MVKFFTSKSIEAGTTEMKLSVYDHNGRLVNAFRHNSGETSIDLSQYADGTYHIIVLLPGDERLHYKIVKAK